MSKHQSKTPFFIVLAVVALAMVLFTLRMLGGGSPADPLWRTDFAQALKEAADRGTLVVIDFYANWCLPCKEMDRTTFADAQVRMALENVVPLKINVDENRQVAKRYGITAVPTTAVVNPSGQLQFMQAGYLDTVQYLGLLESLASNVSSPEPKLGIIGKSAPSLEVSRWFNLPEGRSSVDVSDYREKVIYLYGFQSACPGCHRKGFPTLLRLIDHYEGNDEVVFLAVQTNSS